MLSQSKEGRKERKKKGKKEGRPPQTLTTECQSKEGRKKGGKDESRKGGKDIFFNVRHNAFIYGHIVSEPK